MISTDDIIEKAMDAAESRIEEADSIVDEALVDPPKTPSEEAPVTEETPKEPKPKVEHPQKLSKNGKPLGRPKKTDLSDQKADVENIEAEATSEQTEDLTPIELPAFWSAEEKAVVAKAPKEVQKIIATREAQRNEWANRIANETEEGRAIKNRAYETFEPYRLKLQANGIKDPFEATSRLLAWNELFEQDPKTGIADLMHKNGLSAYDFINEVETPQYPQDPRIEQALQDAAEAKKAAEEYKAQIDQQKDYVFRSQVNAFKEGKDSAGRNRKQFAEIYAPQISQAFDTIQKSYPNMSFEDTLNHAYEFVLAEATKAFGINGNGVAKTNGAQPQKAKAAASSITGAPSNGTVESKPRAKTIDEALDRAEERLGLR